jgi:hypothetical protein
VIAKAIKILKSKKHIHPHIQKVVLACFVVLAVTLVYLSVFDFSKPTYPNIATAQTVWSYNLYNSSGVLWQDPDYTACTAATSQIALNFIALNGTGNYGLSPSAAVFSWTVSTSHTTTESILSYERTHMTTPTTSKGSDPHGERNALNYFGWGNMYQVTYKDVAYASFAAAAKGIVKSIAQTHKPVIVYPWYGSHAQVISGYQATGENPAISDNFTVTGVYLTDPLKSDGYRNAWITLSTWQNGDTKYRYMKYLQTDPIYKDPIDGQIGKTEWYGKWVAVQAFNLVVPTPTPVLPTPTPTCIPRPICNPAPGIACPNYIDSRWCTLTSATPTITPKPAPNPCSVCAVKQSNGKYLVGGACGIDSKTLCQCSGTGTTKSNQVCINGCKVNSNTYDTCR